MGGLTGRFDSITNPQELVASKPKVERSSECNDALATVMNKIAKFNTNVEDSSIEDLKGEATQIKTDFEALSEKYAAELGGNAVLPSLIQQAGAIVFMFEKEGVDVTSKKTFASTMGKVISEMCADLDK